jgi:hypothetical protein
MNAKENGLLANNQYLNCNLRAGTSSKEMKVQKVNGQILQAKGHRENP